MRKNECKYGKITLNMNLIFPYKIRLLKKIRVNAIFIFMLFLGFESLRLRWKALEKSRAFVIRAAYFSGIFSLPMTNAFKCLVREMRYVKYYFGTSFSYLKREFGNC